MGRLLAFTALFLAAAVLVLACGAAWLLGTQAGLRWALERAQDATDGALAVQGARGTLAGGVSVERLAYQAPLARVEAREVRTRADLVAALAGTLALKPLEMKSLRIELKDGEKAAKPAPPAAAPLPFALRVRELAIDRLEVQRGERLEVLHDVRFSRIALDPGAGMALAASGSLRRPDARFPARASVELAGSLERLELRAKGEVADVPAELRALARPFAARPLEALELRAGPADLSRFDAGLPSTALSVRLEGKATAEHTLAGSLSAVNAQPGPIDKARIPVSAVEARFATPDFASATLDDLRIALTKAGGNLEGRASLAAGRLSARLRASEVDLRAIQSTLRRTSLEGPLALTLTPERQHVSARLTEDGIRVQGEVTRVGDKLEIRDLHASAAGGALSGSANLRLGEPLAFDARLELSRFNPAAFGDYPEGSLNASLLAEGRLGEPRRVELRWKARDSTLLGRALQSEGSARLSGQRVTRARAQATYDGSRINVQGAFGGPNDSLSWQLDVPRLAQFAEALEGRLQASGTLSGTWSRPEVSGSAQAQKLRLPGGTRLAEASGKFSGTLESHEVSLSADAPDLALDATLRGGWREGEWTGELVRLSNAGAYPLELAAPAKLTLSPKSVAVGRLQAGLGRGKLLVRGVRWTPGRLASSGEFSGLPAQWLLVATGLVERLQSTLLLDGEWSLTATPRLEGVVKLRRASGDLALGEEHERMALGLREAALEGRFKDGRLSLDARLASRYGTASAEGTVSPAPGAEGLGFGPGSPIAAKASIDFAALRALAQPYLTEGRLDGELRAELQARGTLGEPRLDGRLRGQAIRFEMPQYGVRLRNGVLVAALEGERLRIEEFSVEGGEGRFSAKGSLPLRPKGAPAELSWQASKLTVLDRPDMRLVASGQGEAKFDGRRLLLSGELRADRGFFELEQQRLPELGEDVVIVGRERAPEEKALRLPISLDLMLDLGEDLAVRGQGFDGELAGRVQVVTNKEGELRAYGRLYAVNATFRAYGQRLAVDPGVLIFDGPVDNPSLQITAWRRNQAVEAGVQITGTARAPRVQLVSQPPVPEGERLSWLVLGRAPREATQADLGLLQAAAGALLARGNTMPLDQRIARSFGLDEVSLRGTGELQDRVVAVGKRLSDRLYVSYERGLGAVASNLVKLDYALSQRWSVRAETGTTATGSTSGLGLFYRFSWD